MERSEAESLKELSKAELINKLFEIKYNLICLLTETQKKPDDQFKLTDGYKKSYKKTHEIMCQKRDNATLILSIIKERNLLLKTQENNGKLPEPVSYEKVRQKR